MEKGYFSAALSDITRSPGWFSKLLRMGLLCLVPIFGVVVLYGYLYGWARDIAWNVHRPMPDRIFGNEDGNLYKRGFFIFVISFVFGLIPSVFSWVVGAATGFPFLELMFYGSNSGYAPVVGSLFMGMILSLVGIVLSFIVLFFSWVASMRTALYGTLSSGFQIGKIWAMLRYDFMGLLRIFGMYLICSATFVVSALLIGIVLGIIAGIVTVLMAGNDAVVAFAIISALALLALFVLVCLFVTAFIEALIARALGYWTRQFQVELWGGQEDPLPFEREYAQRQQERFDSYANPYQGANASQGMPFQQAPYQQPGQVPYQQPQQQASYQAAPAPQQAAYPAQAPQGYSGAPSQSYQPISNPVQPMQPGEVVMPSAAVQATGVEDSGAVRSSGSMLGDEGRTGGSAEGEATGTRACEQPPVVGAEPASIADAQTGSVERSSDDRDKEEQSEDAVSKPAGDSGDPSAGSDEHAAESGDAPSGSQEGESRQGKQ